MIGVVLAAAPLFLAVTGMVVVGEQNVCPSKGAVSARLSALLGDEAGAEVPDALVVDGQPGALRVRLLSAQGSLREQKTLDLKGSCDELADAVAAVVVAWRTQLQGDDVPPPVPSPRVQHVYDPPPAPPSRPQPDVELTFGVQSFVGSERWAPGALLAAQSPMGHGFSLAFTLNVPAPRAARDATAKTWRWMELCLIVGPSLRGIDETLVVDVHAGLGLGVNVVTSESLSAASSYVLVPPQLVGGVRWTYRRARALPWFGITLATRTGLRSDSPVGASGVTPDLWSVGLALGGAVTFDTR